MLIKKRLTFSEQKSKKREHGTAARKGEIIFRYDLYIYDDAVSGVPAFNVADKILCVGGVVELYDDFCFLNSLYGKLFVCVVLEQLFDLLLRHIFGVKRDLNVF